MKRGTNQPVYEPDREKVIYENVHRANRGPLADRDLTRIYERLIDVMRKIQKEEFAPKAKAEAATRNWRLKLTISELLAVRR